MRKHYIFYESFCYKNNTSTLYDITVINNQVTCYVNPDKRFLEKMLKMGKSCSYSSKTDKLYYRERVRHVKITRTNQTPYEKATSKTTRLKVTNKVIGYTYNEDKEPD